MNAILRLNLDGMWEFFFTCVINFPGNPSTTALDDQILLMEEDWHSSCSCMFLASDPRLVDLTCGRSVLAGDGLTIFCCLLLEGLQHRWLSRPQCSRMATGTTFDSS